MTTSAFPPMMRPAVWLSCAQVAAILNVTGPVVRSIVDQGELPASVMNGRLRIRPADLQAYLDRSELPSKHSRVK